jgi:hypothetical protein
VAKFGAATHVFVVCIKGKNVDGRPAALAMTTWVMPLAG